MAFYEQDCYRSVAPQNNKLFFFAFVSHFPRYLWPGATKQMESCVVYDGPRADPRSGLWPDLTAVYEASHPQARVFGQAGQAGQADEGDQAGEKAKALASAT